MTDTGRIVRSMSISESTEGVPALTLGWRLKMSLDHPAEPVSAADMADYLGYSRSQISRFMNDKGEPPRDHVLRQWALRCGVSYEWLKTGIIDPNGGDGLPVSPRGWKAEVVDFGARRSQARPNPTGTREIAA